MSFEVTVGPPFANLAIAESQGADGEPLHSIIAQCGLTGVQANIVFGPEGWELLKKAINGGIDVVTDLSKLDGIPPA